MLEAVFFGKEEGTDRVTVNRSDTAPGYGKYFFQDSVLKFSKDFLFQRRIFLSIRRTFRRLLNQKSTPHSIALGVAVGTAVGMTPTIPLQMTLAFCIAWSLKANRFAALLPVWVSNPFTVLPIYYLNYFVGRMVLPVEKITYERFAAAFAESSRNPGGVVEFFKGLVLIFRGCFTSLADVLLAMFVGSLFVAAIVGLASYPLTLRLVTWFRNHREKKKNKF